MDISRMLMREKRATILSEIDGIEIVSLVREVIAKLRLREKENIRRERKGGSKRREGKGGGEEENSRRRRKEMKGKGKGRRSTFQK